MITYTRGDRIPPDLRDARFLHKGKPSAAALRKYWRLLDDGRPDPDCKPYRGRWEIDLHHRAFPEFGEYVVDAALPGRPGTGFDRKQYDKDRYQQQKSIGKRS